MKIDEIKELTSVDDDVTPKTNGTTIKNTESPIAINDLNRSSNIDDKISISSESQTEQSSIDSGSELSEENHLNNGHTDTEQNISIDEGVMGYIEEESMILQDLEEEEEEEKEKETTPNDRDTVKITTDETYPKSNLTEETNDLKNKKIKTEPIMAISDNIESPADDYVVRKADSDNEKNNEQLILEPKLELKSEEVDLSPISEEMSLLEEQNDDNFDDDIDEELEKEIDDMEDSDENNTNSDKASDEKETEVIKMEINEKDTNDVSNSNEIDTKEAEPNDEVLEEINKILDKDENEETKVPEIIEINEKNKEDPISDENLDDTDQLLVDNSSTQMEVDKDDLDEVINSKDTDEVDDILNASVDSSEEMNASDISIESEIENPATSEKKTDTIIENNDMLSKKRNLDKHEDEEEIEAKKPKFDETKIEKEEFATLTDLKSLFSNEMGKLTRKKLEDFCVQKLCEVIGQNSELGELRHQIKVQEQLLESWKNKVQSLTKQTRDLEIVKCRLIGDLRAKKDSGNTQDAIPVKITRSVGLQVFLQPPNPRPRPVVAANAPNTVQTSHMMHNQQRKPRASLPPRLPQTPNTMSPAKSSPLKTIKTITPQKNPDQKESTPILNKALQKPPATPTTPTTPRKPDTNSKGVIDLTDEEDTKKTSSIPVSNVRIMQSQVVTPITSTPSLVATSMSGPRLTYLVTQPNGQQPQQVMLHTFTPGSTPTRPGQVRANIMFKPITANTVGSQRVNTIRLPGNPLTVVNHGMTRAGAPIRLGGIPNLTRTSNPRTLHPVRHPAPLPGAPPLQPSQPTWKLIPPRPSLKISRSGDGIVLSWKILTKELSNYEEIASYQLYAYQENNSPPNTDMWRKVGDVKALALPMACTLTQFKVGNKYHFAVRAVDVKSRVGPFSQPEEITLS